MRDPLSPVEPAPAEKRSDAWLWMGLLLGPVAMGINTIVGSTVAHWTTDTAQKKMSFLVSAIDFVLCIVAFLISFSMHRQFQDADDITPIDGRRQFMAKVAMLLSVLSALLVIAGTIAVVTLHPTD
jgi:uncharacterized membrane protein YidH (DUF202 family)